MEKRVINREHRENVLTLLMRLLYCKFHSHDTTHNPGRDTITNKRTTIIQFLSSCSEMRLISFLI